MAAAPDPLISSIDALGLSQAYRKLCMPLGTVSLQFTIQVKISSISPSLAAVINHCCSTRLLPTTLHTPHRTSGNAESPPGPTQLPNHGTLQHPSHQSHGRKHNVCHPGEGKPGHRATREPMGIMPSMSHSLVQVSSQKLLAMLAHQLLLRPRKEWKQKQHCTFMQIKNCEELVSCHGVCRDSKQRRT